MQHIRLTVLHNPENPSDDLSQVARLRRDLWAHSPVEVDPDNPFCRTRRDADHNTFFEFVTESPEQVRRILQEYGYEGRVSIEILSDNIGLVCARCGFFAAPGTRCPHCNLRDIAPCPLCGEEVACEDYEREGSELFVCPHCRGRVRLEINPDFVRTDGTFEEPVVLVHGARA